MKQFIVIICLFSLLLPGCLETPENYDYTPVTLSGETNTNTWDFVKSRPDIFSEFVKTVRKVEMDSMLYYANTNKYTYLLLNNSAMSDLIATLGEPTATNRGQWINALSYHIIDGYYHGLGILNFDPTYTVTLWRSQDAILTLQLENRTSFNYSRLIVNGMDPAWSSLTNTYKYAVTSNLICTNGVCHVLNRYARPQTNNTFN